MNCLVTGANGFIGGHLVQYLKDKKIPVKSMCRSDPGGSNDYVYGDVTNIDSLVSAFKGIDLVIHAAGVTDTQDSQIHKVNVDGTQNVVSAVIRRKVQRLIHISSTAAVGASFKPRVIAEDFKFNLQHLNYFQSKYLSEQIVIKSAKKKEIEAVILNPTQVYGPGDMIKPSRQSLQLKIAKGRFLFYPPGGVSVVDISSVAKTAYSAISKGVSGERYVLSGENMYTKDMFCLLAEIANSIKPFIPLSKKVLLSIGSRESLLKKIKLKTIISYEKALLGTMFHWFDSTKAKEEFGFNPKPAIEALRTSVEWARNNNLI